MGEMFSLSKNQYLLLYQYYITQGYHGFKLLNKLLGTPTPEPVLLK